MPDMERFEGFEEGFEEEGFQEEIEEAQDMEPEIMRMKWLAEGCKNWDEVIEALKERIEEVEELKRQGYVIVENSDDYIFYEKRS